MNYALTAAFAASIYFMLPNIGKADVELLFGTPSKLPAPINSDSTADWAPSISADGLELYFTSIRGGGSDADIWMAKRESAMGIWDNPVNLGQGVNSTMNDS